MGVGAARFRATRSRHALASPDQPRARRPPRRLEAARRTRPSASSSACPTARRRGSDPARPTIDRPTGSPSTRPMGMVRIGQPRIAGGVQTAPPPMQHVAVRQVGLPGRAVGGRDQHVDAVRRRPAPGRCPAPRRGCARGPRRTSGAARPPRARACSKYSWPKCASSRSACAWLKATTSASDRTPCAGATGQVGVEVVEELAEENDDLVVMDLIVRCGDRHVGHAGDEWREDREGRLEEGVGGGVAGEPCSATADASAVAAASRVAGGHAVGASGHRLVDECRLADRPGERSGHVLARADRHDARPGTEPTVGLRPTTPLSEAGQVMEPLVSVPMATGTSPAATAAPEPDDDPPALRSRAQGLPVRPPTADQPLVERGERKLAHSDRFVDAHDHGPGRSQACDDRSVRAHGAAERAPASRPCPAGRPPRCCP